MDVSVKKMAYQEFLRLEIPDEADFQYELLNGELVKKNAPTGKHQFAQSQSCSYKLRTFCRRSKDLRHEFSPVQQPLFYLTTMHPFLILSS
jgi:Uma2 family endonuclease